MKEIKSSRVKGKSVRIDLPSYETLGVKSIINEDGSIETKICFTSLEELEKLLKNQFEEKTKTNFHIFFLYATMFIIASVFFEVFKISTLSSFVVVFLFDLTDGCFFAKYVINLIKNHLDKEWRSSKGLVAAKNMGITAFNSLGRAPKIEEIGTFSKYTSGTMVERNVFKSIIYIITLSFIPVGENFAIIYTIVAIISIIMIRIFIKKGYHKYVNVFSMKKPSELEIRAVWETLKKVEDIENAPEILNDEYPEISEEEMKVLDEFFGAYKPAIIIVNYGKQK